LGTASNGYLGSEQRETKCDRQHQIHKQEESAAILSRQIRKPPNIAQSHRAARRRKHKAKLPAERISRCHNLFVRFTLFGKQMYGKEN
jgi:hypothetical protein